MAVTIEDARAIAVTLPRSYEALVRGRVKFRVGSLVYAAFSRDETIMGFGFPREGADGGVEVVVVLRRHVPAHDLEPAFGERVHARHQTRDGPGAQPRPSIGGAVLLDPLLADAVDTWRIAPRGLKGD